MLCVRARPAALAVGVALLILTATPACGSDDGETAACGPIQREALDPNHLVHVLDDDSDVEYASDPPTSGPHKSSPGVEGALDEPLSRPLQVGVLEEGKVLIQYRPDLREAARAELEDLAGDEVVVAPAPDLSRGVVATAWTFKRACDEVDVEALIQFVDERAGKGPSQP